MYELKGKFTEKGTTFLDAVVRVSNIRLSEVEGFYRFEIAVHADGTSATPVASADYFMFEIPDDKSKKSLNLRAISIAASVFMPEGTIVDVNG